MTSENEVAYRDGTWAVSDNGRARACFEFIGEGYSGDYDETDPEDAALYRLDVQVATEDAAYDAEETDDPAWAYPADGSICTTVKVDGLTDATARDLLSYAANAIADTPGSSVKRTMDWLSWLPMKRA